MLINTDNETIIRCNECGCDRFEERDVVSVARRPSDGSFHVVKRYKQYVCVKCGSSDTIEEVQVPV